MRFHCGVRHRFEAGPGPAGVSVVAREKARREAWPLFAAINPGGFAALRLETAEKVAAQPACEVDLQTLTNGSLGLRAW